MGILYIVATPIGNLEDITIRAIKLLMIVPVIACEDTRRTGNLIKILKDRFSMYLSPDPSPNLGEGNKRGEVKTRFISVRDWNEDTAYLKVLEALQNSDVALVSDAGTPLISDPGYKLVKMARETGVKVVPIPGCSAIPTALCASGLPTNRFKFWGFVKTNKIGNIKMEKGITHIFYESPKRTNKTIAEIKKAIPDAEVVIARELTKIYEYIGPDDGKTTKGEVTILVYSGDTGGGQ